MLFLFNRGSAFPVCGCPTISGSAFVFTRFPLDGCLGCFQSFCCYQQCCNNFSGFQELTLVKKMCCKRSYCIRLPDLSRSRTWKHSRNGIPDGCGLLARMSLPLSCLMEPLGPGLSETPGPPAGPGARPPQVRSQAGCGEGCCWGRGCRLRSKKKSSFSFDDATSLRGSGSALLLFFIFLQRGLWQESWLGVQAQGTCIYEMNLPIFPFLLHLPLLHFLFPFSLFPFALSSFICTVD